MLPVAAWPAPGGAIQQEHLGALSGAGTAAIAGLPADEYPYLTEAARGARSLSQDREFTAASHCSCAAWDQASSRSSRSMYGTVSPGSTYRSTSSKPCARANRSPSGLDSRTTVWIRSAPSSRARASPRA